MRDKIKIVEEHTAESKTEERRAYNRSYLKQRWPRAETFSPHWEKRELVHIYEDLDFKGTEEGDLKDLEYSPESLTFKKQPEKETTICLSTFEHGTYNAKYICAENKEDMKETLFWSTELIYKATTSFRPWGENQEDLRVIKLEEHFQSCNWYFPLLLGMQHNNCFKRNTKVYILSDSHKGKHGAVVGHGTGFN